MKAGLKTAGAAVLALTAAMMLTGAAKPAKPAPAAAKPGWTATTTVTPEGHHVMGNPKAPLRLVEFVSYTCPHCSHFETESEAQLKIGFVGPGKGAVEVRNFVRDPVDMTVALITNCVAPSRFFATHNAFMRTQPTWIAPLAKSTDAQRKSWFDGDFTTRTRAIARDFHFYEIMAARGMNRAALDRCLANEPLAQKLAAQTRDATDTLYVSGTPSFMIDGVLLAGTHDWASLRPQLLARMK